MNSSKNILITGLPRSGTNLTCRLLNQVEDVVALQEPMDVGAFGRLGSPSEIYAMIDEFIHEVRTAAVEEGMIFTKHVQGQIVDNFYQPPDEKTKIRMNLSERGYIKIDRKVTEDLVMAIKHNTAFAGLLPDLQNHYSVFAMIRHPLWVLASWNSNNLPMYDGHIPMGEQFDPKLTRELAEIPDRIDRQIRALSWLFERFSTLADQNRIIRYEDLMASGGKSLKVMVPGAEQLNEPLSNENRAARYPFAPLEELKKRLLEKGGSFFDYYPRQSLLDEHFDTQDATANQFSVSQQKYGWEVAPPMKPVFIIGCARSGTSILGELIASHPGVKYIFEASHIWELGGAGENESHRLTREHATEAVKNQIRDWFKGQAEGADVLVEKNPRNSLRIPYISEIFPGARFIHIVRDGRDVACSMIPGCGGREWNHLKPPSWKEYYANYAGAVRCAHAWKQTLEIALKDLSAVPHLQISFEDLVASPSSIAKQLFGFLGLDLHPNTAEFCKKISNETSSSYHAKFQDQWYQDNHTRRMGRWQENLSAEESEVLHDLLQPLLTRLGYMDNQKPKSSSKQISSSPKSNKLVVVLGMHRSGTSAITRALRVLGVDLGEKLIPQKFDNPKGFWEDEDLTLLDIEMLQAVESDWDSLRPVQPKDDEILHKKGYASRAAQLLYEKTSAVELFGFKDPRIARLLPFWKGVFAQSHLEPRYILVIRHPLSVYKSLAERNGFDAEKSSFLWLEHIVQCLVETVGERCMVVDYDRLMQSPEAELGRMSRELELEIDPDELKIFKEEFLDQGLRHTVYSLEDLLRDPSTPQVVKEIYTEMLSVASATIRLDDSEFRKKIAQWKQELDSLNLVLVWTDKLDSKIKVLTEETRARQEELKARVEDVSALRGEVRDRTEDIKTLQADIQVITEQNALQIDKLTQDVDTLAAGLRDWEDRWADLQMGMAWKLMQKMRALYHSVAPFGSRRDRLVRLGYRSLATWRNEGFRALYKRAAVRTGLQVPTTTELISDIRDAENRPRVSIVIPVFNALGLTQQCIEGIYRETQNVNFEIVVIDNASEDGTDKWLKSKQETAKNFAVLHMEENIGFGPAVNVGIQKSRGDYIVILNNDTIPAPGWLDHMLAALDQNPTIGIVSPMTNYVGEGPQIDQAARDLPPEVHAIQQYAQTIQDRSELYFEPNRLVFFCVILRRDLVDMVGYLDSAYEKGNFEDDDYCVRARMAGYRLAIVKNAFVYHMGSATFTKNKISHSQFMEQNRRLFYEKVGRIATASRLLPASVSSEHTEPEISVVVRTLNRPVLLQKALSSLANQTSQNFEAVVINDGGEDISELVGEFRSFFPIQYVYNETSQGRSASANAGIRHSRGRWIAFLDDDDILYPWHFEALLQAGEQSGCKFVYSDFNRALFLTASFTTPDKLLGADPRDFTRNLLLVQNFFPIHTWLFARECIDKVGLIDKDLDRLEDYDFLLRLSSQYSFHHLPKVTCEYRYYLHSTNSIYTDRHKSLEALKVIYQRYPADAGAVAYERQELIRSVEKQIEKIEEIKNGIGVRYTEQEAQRQIMMLVTGL